LSFSYILPDYNHLFSHMGIEGKGTQDHLAPLMRVPPGCGLQGAVSCFYLRSISSLGQPCGPDFAWAWKQVIGLTNCYLEICGHIFINMRQKHSDKTYTAIPKLVLTLLKCDVDLLCFMITDKRAFISYNFFSLLTNYPNKWWDC